MQAGQHQGLAVGCAAAQAFEGGLGFGQLILAHLQANQRRQAFGVVGVELEQAIQALLDQLHLVARLPGAHLFE
ncbi:hypothetical protein D3C71_1737970 [compost metagenome]